MKLFKPISFNDIHLQNEFSRSFVYAYNNSNLRYRRTYLRDSSIDTVQYTLHNINTLCDVSQYKLVKPKLSWLDITNKNTWDIICSCTDIINILDNDKYTDVINWDLVSKYQPLTTGLVEIFREKINFELLSYNQRADINVFYEFSDQVNWNIISSWIDISRYDVSEIQELLNWSIISSRLWDYDTISMYDEYIDFKIIQYALYDPYTIVHYIDRMDTSIVSQNVPIDSFEFIDIVKDVVDWKIISARRLDHQFIMRYVKYIDFSILSTKYVTEETLDECSNLINWTKVFYNNKISCTVKSNFRNKMWWIK